MKIKSRRGVETKTKEVALIKPKVVLVVGDMGAWQYFAPIMPELTRRYEVELLADPKGAAKNEIEKVGVSHRVTDGKDLFETGALDGVYSVLCGTAGKTFELWENASQAAINHDVPFAWFGYFYSSGCEAQMLGCNPNYFAAFDTDTAARFMTEHLGIYEDRIRIVGNPSFDAIASFDVATARYRTREALSLKESEQFVCYSASSMEQFSLERESLNNLISWVKGRARFAARFHPADEKNKPEYIARLRKRLSDELGPQMVDTKEYKGLELAVAADVFVTDYSTEGVRACLVGIPTAFLMLKTSQEYLHRAKGSQHPHFSILDDGPAMAPALGIYEPKKVKDLSLALTPEWRRRQEKVLRQPRFQVLCDGHAGERVLEFIEKIVGE
ncbi:hypothetical protein A2673_03665 [Candidatus Kaiserbacteria bacterium RIFCSPHIGHO2_01_FULL_50_13]|uniref:UDP-N-acetylglucosamine 2-epimerase domain-containing protein n=1 Tax=Candidatus Kaiserbacteria bacterium RIFCSPLOWO2_01_FULL_50_24 TaxID=1798507 RepID=A0A1F6EIU3_9BACT|nr:MAG: hypothetical protein A2673_03665 [Candidatus Kaiserbacteria bacterium RIFCSPHIGHO2_01_FULL_50_13]OGG73559.1 MAG: hypothetical protein A3A34_02685 [Candidatus Kaiserbacteria bacterium RIFCSPLOWO2_01_FULL_50_24]OGG82182.1 MAG: hypothetical protein A3H74_03305 [Candidatus Kaiserbacteria bacterium RIFCSPLOWO2_02_FULL_51_13]